MLYQPINNITLVRHCRKEINYLISITRVSKIFDKGKGNKRSA